MSEPHQISESKNNEYLISTQDEETKEVAELYFRLPKRKRQIILDLLREL